MPGKPAGKAASQPPETASSSAYPNIESLIERATPGEVGDFFAQVRAGLSALKGPKADAAKKVAAALENTQELLGYLLQVRDRLAAERQGAKGRK